MTKGKFISLVKAHLQKNDNTRLYDDRVIEHTIAMAWASILYAFYTKYNVNLDFYAKEYNAVTVSYDDTTDRYYCDLPAPILKLNDTNEGVRRINLPQSRDLEFVPASIEDIEYEEGDEVDQIDTIIRYIIRYNRIWFIDSLSGINDVSMTLVVPFTEYADTDDIPIPGGQDMQLFTSVIQMLKGIPFKDLSNTNN